jgi:hypothetical protein
MAKCTVSLRMMSDSLYKSDRLPLNEGHPSEASFPAPHPSWLLAACSDSSIALLLGSLPLSLPLSDSTGGHHDKAAATSVDFGRHHQLALLVLVLIAVLPLVALLADFARVPRGGDWLCEVGSDDSPGMSKRPFAAFGNCCGVIRLMPVWLPPLEGASGATP